MKDKRKIYTKLINGGKQEFDVIMTFRNEQNQKDYVIYTDNEHDKENKLKIYAAKYDPYTLEFLGTPTSEEEWEQIDKLLTQTLLEE